MKDIRIFNRELSLIKDDDLRSMVRCYLVECVPEYFWTEGASSSGKYHPKFSQGIGGLVRHTKAVVMFAEELLHLNTYSYMKEEFKDCVIAACLLHDTVKYGFTDYTKEEYKNHARNASCAFKTFCSELNYKPSEFLLMAIESHMGQWSTEKEDRPFTNVDRCVHMADYMASRSFIDIPNITKEWDALAELSMEIPF